MKLIARLGLPISILLVTTQAVAEVSDKVPSIPRLWVTALLLSGLSIALGRIKPWAALIPGVAGLALIFAFVDTYSDSYLAQGIRTELGQYYMWQDLFCSVLPVPVALIVFLLRIRPKVAGDIDA